jgi:hypothetical protein
MTSNRTTPKKQTQYLINAGVVNAESILQKYNVKESDLFRVYEALVKYVIAAGIVIQQVDLSNLNEGQAGEEADHAETCTSDGHTIYLHNQLKDHGGILTRIYDVMHMWCGHLIQWWSDEKQGISRYGDKAWEIWSVFHMGADAETLSHVQKYELEAWQLGLSCLSKILRWLALDSSAENIMKLYNDYVMTDNDYIIDYYHTGESKNFFSQRQYNTPRLPLLNTNIQFTPLQRTMIDIGLIRSDT